jgi:hypothetical protein
MKETRLKPRVAWEVIINLLQVVLAVRMGAKIFYHIEAQPSTTHDFPVTADPTSTLPSQNRRGLMGMPVELFAQVRSIASHSRDR